MSLPGNRIFVYGLLMLPEVVRAITGREHPLQQACLADHKRYGLSKQPGETPVPALTQCPGHVQQGMLLTDIDDEELARLDFFEELDSGLYLRQLVRVQSHGLWLDAWCYKVGPALQPYLAGDWSLDLVTVAHKQHLLTQVIPQMLTTYTTMTQHKGKPFV